MRVRRSIMALVLLGVAAALGVAGASRGADATHHVIFDVRNARNLLPGLHVRAAGQRVGEIEEVLVRDGGRRARVTLALTEDEVWPLSADSAIRVRFGGTIAANARYLELVPGRASHQLDDGGEIEDVQMPVEFDDVFNTFGPRTRQDLRRTVDAAGATLDSAGPSLRRALRSAPPAVHHFRGVLVDLGDEHESLDTLVRSTDRVLAATERADPDLGRLLTDAATTFVAVNEEARAVERGIAEAPGTLRSARTTLVQVDRTLTAATSLSRNLSPGVDELVALIDPLNRTLRTARDVAPRLTTALATTRRAAPDVVELLEGTRALIPDLASTLTQTETQLGCLRPYSPEIAGLASTWAGFVANGDKKNKYARLFNAVYPFPNDTPLTVPQLSKLMPGPFQSWGFPRAPGANVGQPWYQPDCGVTADGADPQKAPEAIPFDPFSKKLVEWGP